MSGVDPTNKPSSSSSSSTAVVMNKRDEQLFAAAAAVGWSVDEFSEVLANYDDVGAAVNAILEGREERWSTARSKKVGEDAPCFFLFFSSSDFVHRSSHTASPAFMKNARQIGRMQSHHTHMQYVTR